MAANVSQVLRRVLGTLEAERSNIDRQVSAVRHALQISSDGHHASASVRQRKPMSAATRRALSRRMKAFWAKKRAAKTVGERKK